MVRLLAASVGLLLVALFRRHRGVNDSRVGRGLGTAAQTDEVSGVAWPATTYRYTRFSEFLAGIAGQSNPGGKIGEINPLATDDYRTRRWLTFDAGVLSHITVIEDHRLGNHVPAE